AVALVGWLVVLWRITGDPKAILTAEANWGVGPSVPFEAFTDLFDPKVYGFPYFVLGFTLFIGTLVILSWRFLRPSLAAYATVVARSPAGRVAARRSVSAARGSDRMRNVVQKYPNGARYPAVASVSACHAFSFERSRRAAMPAAIAKSTAPMASASGNQSDQNKSASSGGPGRAMCA